ncbi:hypothetical protein EHO60_00840 [Leptospira fletcheri]|uniref:Exo-alpha-sialidase n=1 Tax=Leptospira fletcheri TaxID=2484981 RepID=A0A4R9GJS5_9LEPT|nr:hypothetical protein [Leptospira fletcheri]TGK13930.1 hypothetical protein EHO60_00840 [Leptospira fletcheri]
MKSMQSRLSRTAAGFFLLFICSGCMKFQEASLDPQSNFSLLTTLLGIGDSVGYNSFPDMYQRFRTVGTGVQFSYITRQKGLQPSVLDLLFTGGSTGTYTVSTNVPGSGLLSSTIALNAGANGSASGFYAMFEVTGTNTYYFAQGVLPLTQGANLNFTQVTPPMGGTGFTSIYYNSGYYYWCESGASYNCYRAISFPSSGTSIANLTTCVGPKSSGTGYEFCGFGISGSSGAYSMSGQSVSSAGLSSNVTTSLISSYGYTPFTLNGSNASWAFADGYSQAFFLDVGSATTSLRINTTPVTNFTVSSSATFTTVNVTPPLYLTTTSSISQTVARMGVSGSGVLVSTMYPEISAQAGYSPLYVSLDAGATWTLVDTSALPLGAAGSSFYANAYTSTIDSTNAITIFISVPSATGTGLYWYTTTNNGASWTGPNQVPFPN